MSTAIQENRETNLRKAHRIPLGVAKSRSAGSATLRIKPIGNGASGAVQTIIRLLTEYTPILVEQQRQYIDALERAKISILSIVALGVLSLGGIVVYAAMSHHVESEYRMPAVIVALGSTFVLGVALNWTYLTIERLLLMTKQRRKEASRRIVQLEKLVRRATQLEEFGVADFGQRLELDFRITDAESAIALAQSTLRLQRDDTRPYTDETSFAGDRPAPRRPAETLVAK